VYDAGSDTLQVYFVREGEFGVRRRPEEVSTDARARTSGTDGASPTETCRQSVAVASHDSANVRRSSVADTKPSAEPTTAPAATSAPQERKLLGNLLKKTVHKVMVKAAVANALGARMTFPEATGSQRVTDALPIVVPRELGDSQVSPQSPFVRRRLLWCTVAHVAANQVIGLADYLRGARVHSERVICESEKGFVYGVLAKELVSHLDAKTKERMRDGASAHEEFLRKRAFVVGHLAKTSLPGQDAEPSEGLGKSSQHRNGIYTREGRLRNIARAVMCFNQKEAARASRTAGHDDESGLPVPPLLFPKLSLRHCWHVEADTSGCKSDARKSNEEHPVDRIWLGVLHAAELQPTLPRHRVCITKRACSSHLEAKLQRKSSISCGQRSLRRVRNGTRCGPLPNDQPVIRLSDEAASSTDATMIGIAWELASDGVFSSDLVQSQCQGAALPSMVVTTEPAWRDLKLPVLPPSSASPAHSSALADVGDRSRGRTNVLDEVRVVEAAAPCAARSRDEECGARTIGAHQWANGVTFKASDAELVSQAYVSVCGAWGVHGVRGTAANVLTAGVFSSACLNDLGARRRCQRAMPTSVPCTRDLGTTPTRGDGRSVQL